MVCLGVNAGRFLATGDMTSFRKILGICVNFYAGGIYAGVTGSNLDMIFKGMGRVRLCL